MSNYLTNYNKYFSRESAGKVGKVEKYGGEKGKFLP